ncbi:MAG: hypothetical protein E7420_03320 [Ruminococcaceae bacterium]|nr:hypothetical protein [Oscillospiraceae bacterium]
MRRMLVAGVLLLIIGLLPGFMREGTETGEVLMAAKLEIAKEEAAVLEVSAGDFRKSVLRICPDALLEGEPSSWLGQAKAGEYLFVGGREISARTMSRIFLLESADFELCWTGECFSFSVNGVDKTYSGA